MKNLTTATNCTMLNFLRDLPRTWHMNLKQCIFSIGLLTALVASETKAQAGTPQTTGYSSLATSTVRDVNVTSTVPVSQTLQSPSDSAQRFCNNTYNHTYETTCLECNKGKFQPCRAGEIHVTNKSCDALAIFPLRVMQVPGCRALCLRPHITQKCCYGFWGADCSQTCPGGSQNPCNGHGKCLDVQGRCVCDHNFRGKACELCILKNRYGPNCDKDCTCTHGECNSGIYGDGACTSDNPCNNPISPCDINSHCLHTGPGTHQCVCDEGFTGIGDDCLPIDTCKINNGGCDDTQDCFPNTISKRGPRVDCRCKTGYEQKDPDKACKLKDMCTPGLCGSIATCETREPLKYSCVCPDGHTWNGQACSENLIQQIGTLPNPVINYMHKMASKVFDTLLSRYGLFTIFVPVDEAFRKVINDTEFEKILNDDYKIKKILHQYIVAGECQMTPPDNLCYNLQGNLVELHVEKKNNTDVRYYTINYDLAQRENVEMKGGGYYAVNGYIYFLSDAIKNLQFEDHKRTLMDLIKNTPEYSTMYSMIMVANLSEIFSLPNTTVLITNNRAWSNFSIYEKHFLTSEEEGLEKLAVILKNHVFPGTIDVTDLIIMQNMKSYANINVKVQVSNRGQITLDDVGAKITKTSILVSTGLCHLVDTVLVPSYLRPLFNNTCEDTVTELVEGPCMNCYTNLRCSEPTDEPTGEKKSCNGEDIWDYDGPIWGLRFGRSIKHPWHRHSFICSAICKRKIKKRSCCAGFYGRSCIACPGGFRNPCSGNGECSDGEKGKGLCFCQENFIGTACNYCAQNNTFGPRCNKTCTCQFGQCDTGPEGTGKCKPRTCQLGYTGENCDEKLIPCEIDDICQANSKCFLDGTNSFESCYCPPGYENDGDSCSVIDLCAEESSPCHQQATCSQEGPGAISCICNKGWHGDGFQCMPNHPCDKETDCHKGAVCHNVEPGKYQCVCAPSFRGNGLTCKIANLCLEFNGGCHPDAKCTFIKDGKINCTCPPLMSGDGVTCHGTIYEEVMNHPALGNLRGLMKNVNLSNLLQDTVNTTYTFFAPSDHALDAFFQAAGEQNRLDELYHEEHVLTFLKFHTIYNGYTTDDMMALDGVMRRYPTLYDGYSLRIVNTNQSLHIFVNQSRFAEIEEANIPATNGYFHIISEVLEPFIPDDREPSLSDLLLSKPEYQMFYEALQKTKLLENISSLHEYTLFVLPNGIVRSIDRKLTADYLKYYIVPQLIFTPCIIDGDVVDTLLGSRHRLQLNLWHPYPKMWMDRSVTSPHQIFVNEAAIKHGDILTDRGVIHELAQALHPLLNRCDVNSSTLSLGPCGDCMTGNLTCHDGFTSLGASHVIKYNCHFKKHADMTWETIGCNQICAIYTTISQCCAGFYGYNCEDCPGGAENPCSGNGVCHIGSGVCKCNIGFSGTACDRCDSTDLVPPYCNISYNSCEYMNGNCSNYAWCNETNSGITCQCFRDYDGDGHTCRSKCYSAEQGECHSQAKCVVIIPNQTFRCKCNPGFHGNGTWCQQNRDLCTSNNGGCDLERAVCRYTQPRVTDMNEGNVICTCKSNYFGDGKLCSTDLLDAISRIPELKSFYSWLLTAKDNNITITELSGRRSGMVFISVNKLISNASIAVVDRRFSLPNYCNTEDEVTNTTSKRISKDRGKPLWTFTTLNGQLIYVTLNDQGKCLANGVEIIRKNILAANGILHLTAGPLFGAEHEHSSSQAYHANKVIPGVTTAVIVVLVALIAIVIYKKWPHICRRSPTNPQCNIAFTKITTDDSGDPVSMPDNAEFNNPLFNDQNVQ